MRKTALSALAAALVGAGVFAFVASGSDRSHGIDVRAASARTARAATVHFAVAVRMTKQQQPLVLHIDGASSRDAVAVHLRLDAIGSGMPGTTGAILMSKPFLYERAPGGVAVVGDVRWLRLVVTGMSPRSQTLSTVRALTPSPLLRLIAESKLRPTARVGTFAGAVPYDDPVVRTALKALAAGVEFRNLRISVSVGRDGLVHRVRLTGRTADRTTRFALAARLYGFGAPVNVLPPKPGTFVDQQLDQLTA